MTKAPSWLAKVVENAASNIVPRGIMGPLGCAYLSPAETNGSWEVAIYPTPAEVYAGPMDGTSICPMYAWNLQPIINQFDSMPSIGWSNCSNDKSRFQGSELAMKGTMEDIPVLLRLFNVPPSNEDPTVMVDPAAGKAWFTDTVKDKMIRSKRKKKRKKKDQE